MPRPKLVQRQDNNSGWQWVRRGGFDGFDENNHPIYRKPGRPRKPIPVNSMEETAFAAWVAEANEYFAPDQLKYLCKKYPLGGTK
jgi:hypothetical protein